jgi:hypothetical protein
MFACIVASGDATPSELAILICQTQGSSFLANLGLDDQIPSGYPSQARSSQARESKITFAHALISAPRAPSVEVAGAGGIGVSAGEAWSEKQAR